MRWIMLSIMPHRIAHSTVDQQSSTLPLYCGCPSPPAKRSTIMSSVLQLVIAALVEPIHHYANDMYEWMIGVLGHDSAMLAILGWRQLGTLMTCTRSCRNHHKIVFCIVYFLTSINYKHMKVSLSLLSMFLSFFISTGLSVLVSNMQFIYI